MLAPLPRLYRILVVAIVIGLGIGAGVWLSQSYPLPARGLLVGPLAGLVIAYLLTHDFHQDPRPARIPRRR